MDESAESDLSRNPRKRCSFAWLKSFHVRIDMLKLSVAEIVMLENIIQCSPKGGTVVSGSNGIRKVRFSPPSLKRGKSGAFRVFYLDASEHGLFFLVTILDKTEEANLTREDINFFAGQMAIIKQTLRRRS